MCLQQLNRVQEKKPKEKIKHKHKSKKKSHKKEKADAQGHNSPEPRLSNSPCVSVEQPASDTADPQPDSTAAQEPHAAEWDSLLNRVSDPRQQATGSKEPASQKHSVSQAPRIDNKPSDRIGGGAGGGGSGRVGDGGSGWRRRLQKRQGQDGANTHLQQLSVMLPMLCQCGNCLGSTRLARVV